MSKVWKEPLQYNMDLDLLGVAPKNCGTKEKVFIMLTHGCSCKTFYIWFTPTPQIHSPSLLVDGFKLSAITAIILFLSLFDLWNYFFQLLPNTQKPMHTTTTKPYSKTS